jgi:hypothetical protein
MQLCRKKKKQQQQQNTNSKVHQSVCLPLHINMCVFSRLFLPSS